MIDFYKKIVIITPEVFPIPPIKGGAVETWIFKVAKEMDIEELNILSIQSDSLSLEEKDGNIKYFRYKKSWLDNLSLVSYKFPTKNSKSFYYWYFYSFWCAKVCQRIKPAIIHIHNRWQFVPVIKKFNPNAKICFHVHQLSALNFSEKQADLLKKQVDGFIACSNFIAQKIKEKLGISDNKISVVVNGVDIETFFPCLEFTKDVLKKKYGLEGNGIILFAGRLTENKGAHILIQAFNKIKISKVKLLLAGGVTYSANTKSDYVRYLEKLSEEKKDNIVFLGYVPHEKIADVYKMSDIFVLPSLVEEALGMSLAEAMAIGLGVVGSNRGGVGELIDDNVNGFLIQDYMNVDAWREKIEKLLRDKDLSSSLGKKAREKILKNFTWGNVSKQLEQTYSGLLNS
jgi:spore coat protein SA